MNLIRVRTLTIFGLTAILSLFAQTRSRAATSTIPLSKLPWRISPTEITPIRLGNGSFLLSGDFALLDDQHIGSTALLLENGTLAPAFPDLKLAGIQIPLAKRLSNGNIIAYINLDSTSFPNNENRPRQHTFETELGPRKVNFIYELPAAILDDGTLIFKENSSVLTYVDGILTTVSISSIHYASIDETGEIVHREYDQRFSHRGYISQVLPLPDGKLLLLAARSGETGQLLRLLPDLTTDPTFAPSLLSHEIFELHDPKLAFASNGDLFVFSTLQQYEPNPPPYLLRLNDDGSIDQSFSLTTPFFTTPDTQIQATLDGYRILNVNPVSSDLCQPVIQLDRSGNIDDTFKIDDSDFDSSCYDATYIALDEETTLAAVPSSSIGSLQWYQIDPTGTATRFETGQLSSVPALLPTWNENQELFYATSSAVLGEETYSNWKNGIVRSDGTHRLFLANSRFDPLFTTLLGNHLTRYFSSIDSEGQPREYNPSVSGVSLIGQSPSGLLYAIILNPDSATSGNHVDCIARLYPGGRLDPTFKPYPLTIHREAIAVAYQDLTYIVSHSQDNYTPRLHRLLQDGTVDPTFKAVTLSEFPTQVQPTPSGIYLASHPSYPLHVNNAAKPLGARILLDGSLDPTYRPETFLNRDQSDPNENHTITEDGHLYLFAERRGSPYREENQIWCIPPIGDPYQIEPDTYWKSPYIDVSRQGSLFISGIQITPLGSAQTSRIYHTRLAANSFPKRVYLATGTQNIEIPVTFPNSDSLSFQWLQNGILIPGAETPTISLPTADLVETTELVLIATDTTGETTAIGPFHVIANTEEVPSLIIQQSPSSLLLAPTFSPRLAQVLQSIDLENWQPFNTIIPNSLQDSIALQPTNENTFWKIKLLPLD